MLTVVVLIGVMGVSPSWVAYPAPKMLHKHCLCRVLESESWVRDQIIPNVFSGACQTKCPPLREKQELCAVYTKGTHWTLAKGQPTIKPKSFCRELLRTDKTLTEWATVYTSAAVQPYKNINFLWWGALAGNSKHFAAATAQPLRLSEMLSEKGYQLTYYHQTTASGLITLSQREDVNIKFVSIGAGGNVETPGDLLEGTDLEDQSETISNIIASFERYGARTFAAVKDLLIMCVLYKHGGYFFDTNVRPVEGLTGDDLDERLEAFGAHRAFPGYPRLREYNRFESELVELTMEFHPEEDVKERIIRFAKMEFNGGFSPAGHPMIKEAILQYIEQVKNRELQDPAVQPKAAVHDVFSSGAGTFKTHVGQMIRWSVVSAFFKYAHDAPMVINDFLFDVRAVDGGIEFKPLGLEKIYGNTWKKDLEELEDVLSNLQ